MSAVLQPSALRSAPSPASAIAQAVFDLEKALDLADPVWLDEGIHWWPLYRLELYRRLFLQLAAAPSTGGAARATRLGPALRRAFTPAESSVPGAVWLVSDGISFSALGNRHIERFCDPLRDASRSLGRAAVVVDRGSAAPRTGCGAMRWWAPWTQRAKVVGSLAARLAPDRRHERRIGLIRAAAASAAIALPALPARRFDAMARAIKRLSASLQKRIRREQVQAVFVVGYYDLAGYAYVLAAAREGVPSVDIQHGVAGRFNLAYADWPASAAGSLLLPRWFWTWTRADADVVDRWAHHATTSPRRAVVGGHPFLEQWRDGRLGLDAAAQDHLQRLLATAGHRPRVLVTLQPHLGHREALAPLLWAWRHAPDVCWWLRLHPMALEDRDPIAALAREHGVECFDIDGSSALPLPVLLSHAHVHATHSSSTVIEAEAMGVSSIVWSAYGAELAEDAVERGIARVALDGPAFQRALDHLPAAGTIRRPLDPSTAEQALRTILEFRE